MPNYLNILIFVVTFPSVCLWLQIKLLLTSLTPNKKSTTILGDKKLLNMVKTKTGYNLKTIYIINSNRPFGMMSGIFKPHLILSQKLHQEFNEDETEYVLLHEMGHFLLHHNLKEVVVGIIILVAGATTISYYNIGLLASTFLSFAFGILMIQVARQYEYQADSYALKRTGNPKGMITATQKFQQAYSPPRNKLLDILFYRGNPFANRIKMAKAEINYRLKNK